MDDTAYFHQRAETELRMAERSPTPQAVRALYELAQRYLDRVFGEGGNGSATDGQSLAR